MRAVLRFLLTFSLFSFFRFFNFFFLPFFLFFLFFLLFFAFFFLFLCFLLFSKKIYEISSQFRKLSYRELFKYLLCMSDKDIIEVSAKYFHDVCEFIKSL